MSISFFLSFLVIEKNWEITLNFFFFLFFFFWGGGFHILFFSHSFSCLVFAS